MSAGIEVVDLTKRYPGARRPALDGVTLHIQPGEAFGLVGPNGAGKTTFLGCLLGLLRADRGRVRIDGEAPDELSARAKIGYVPERQQLDPWMSGRELLAYHHELARQPAGTRDEDVRLGLSRVGLDDVAAAARVRRYSRGMLQRLAIAQALIGRPRYLFLDEPSSGVDPAGVLLLRQIIAERVREGTTVIFNSHQLDQIERSCRRVAFLKAGKIESLQDLALTERGQRTIRVRWIAYDTDAAPLGGRSLDGVALLDHGRDGARFVVSDDAACAALVAALVAEGRAILAVEGEEGRLEQLFASPAGAVTS